VKRVLLWILLILIVAAAAAIVAGISFRAALGPAVETYPARAVYAPHGPLPRAIPSRARPDWPCFNEEETRPMRR